MNKQFCPQVVSFLLMTAAADLLIGDSALLLYFSESRRTSQNYINIYKKRFIIYI